MRIIHISRGYNSISQGTTHSVGAPSQCLQALGNDVTAIGFGKHTVEWPYDVKLVTFDGYLERIGLMGREPIRYIRGLSRKHVILHGHGAWTSANLFPLLLPSNRTAKVIWSPEGMFTEWSLKQKAWRKYVFWRLLQHTALNMIDCFHATAESEYEDIRRLGFTEPVAIIPNGVDVPKNIHDVKKAQRIVFLSRIHPKKGLEMLILAWKNLAQLFPDWELQIAGPLDSSYANKMVELARRVNAPRLSFVGEIVGERKKAFLSEARLFVLPTYSENYGIAIAEALSHGTPVITTTEAPWGELESRGCGWIINAEQSALENALRESLLMTGEHLDSMGMIGREWMIEKYSWERMARMLNEVYGWLLDGDPCPAYVVT